MYVDAKTQFADAQVLTADAPSENVIDHGFADDKGIGENMYIVVVAKVDLAGTLQVDLESAVAEDMAGAVVTNIGSFAADAVAGTSLVYRVAPGTMVNRFTRLTFVGATAGTVGAFITHDIDATKNYASGFDIVN